MEIEVLQRVRGFIKSQGVTIQKLAKELDMNSNTLTSKLNGHSSLDLETLCSIMNVFPELSSEWLLRGKGEPTTSASDYDKELQETCIEQAKEIMRLRRQLNELQGERSTKHA